MSQHSDQGAECVPCQHVYTVLDGQLTEQRATLAEMAQRLNAFQDVEDRQDTALTEVEVRVDELGAATGGVLADLVGRIDRIEQRLTDLSETHTDAKPRRLHFGPWLGYRCVKCPTCHTWWARAQLRSVRWGRNTEYYQIQCGCCGVQRWRAD